MTKPAFRRSLALAAPLLALLTACGGGGGGGGGDTAIPNTNTYNLDAAISRAMQDGVTLTGLAGTANGTSFTLALRYEPQSDGFFQGTVRRQVRETVTISGAGRTDTQISSQYFSTGPFLPHGAVDVDGTLTVLTSTGNLPTAARVGDSGPLHTGAEYEDGTRATLTATSRTTWSLDADSATTALACLRSTTTVTGDPQPITGAQCFRINTAGDVLGAVVTVQQGSIGITFR